MADNDTLRLRIAVDGKQVIPEAMSEASAAVQASTDKMIALLASMNKSLDEINARGTAAMRNVGSHAKAAGYDVGEARHAIRGLGEEVGIAMPRFVSSFLAELPGVGSAMAAAFSTVAVIGLIQVLAEIPELLKKAIESLNAWNARAEEAFREELKYGVDLREELRKEVDARRDAAAAGLEGLSKMTQQFNTLSERQRNSREELESLNEELLHSLDIIGKYDSVFSATGWMSPEMVAQAKERAKSLKEEIAKLTGELNAQNLEQVKLTGEIGRQSTADTRTLAAAQIEARKKVADATLGLKEAEVRGSYLLGRIGLDEETAALKENEEAKFRVLQESLEKRRALALREQQETGKPAGPAVATINADEAAARKSTDARIQAIEDQAAAQTIQRENQVALARITARSRYEESAIAMDESSIRRLADFHQLSIEQEAEALGKLNAERVAKQRQGIEQQLEIARQFPERNAAQIAGLEAQLNQITADGEARRAEIRADADAKQLARNQQFADMRESQAESAADFELQQNERINSLRLAASQEMLGRWQQNELDAINRWYESKRATLQAAADYASNIYGADSTEYAEALNRMTQLDRDRLTRVQEVQDRMVEIYQRSFDRANDSFLSGMRQWALGQTTLKKALQQTWNDIVLDLAGALAKMGLKWVEHWALVHLLHIGAKATELSTEATAVAAKNAIISASNAAVVGSEAGVAGAAGVASVMVALPFPANIAVAPEVGAAAAAEALSFAPLAAFERGGLSDKDQIALIHKKEMMLPADLSEGLQNMIRGGDKQSGPTNHFNIHVSGVSASEAPKVGRSIADEIRKAFRKGQLGYGDFQ